MRLNGWQRLWELASILYAAPITFTTWKQLPGPEQITHRWEFYERLPKESQERMVLTAEELFDPQYPGVFFKAFNGNQLAFREGVTEKDANGVVDQYNHILKTEAAKKALVPIAISIAIWLLSCAVAYAFGWAIGWVRRGFRNK